MFRYFMFFLVLFSFSFSLLAKAGDESSIIPTLYVGIFDDSDGSVGLIADGGSYPRRSERQLELISMLNDFPLKLEVPTFARKDLTIAVRVEYGMPSEFKNSDVYKEIQQYVKEYNKTGVHSLSLKIVKRDDIFNVIEWLGQGDIVLRAKSVEGFNQSIAAAGGLSGTILGFVPIIRYNLPGKKWHHINAFSVLEKDMGKAIINTYACEFKYKNFNITNIKACFEAVGLSIGDQK